MAAQIFPDQPIPVLWFTIPANNYSIMGLVIFVSLGLSSLAYLFFCIYNSLAHAYKNACDDIETINKKEYKTIIIFGGGCQNTLLNKLTEEICKKKVICGPVEATAIGNILSQIS